MIHSTNGIVLRMVKYGETSVIVTILTSRFGIQSYLVNGVRTGGRTGRAHFFQPASLLEMEVYHNELKNLQRIKEVRWRHLYRDLFDDVIKNSVALYMIELLQKCAGQPEPGGEMYDFAEEAFLELDAASREAVANYPVYFALQAARVTGLRILNNHSSRRPAFSVSEGQFVSHSNPSDFPADERISEPLARLLEASSIAELPAIRPGKSVRRALLAALEKYFQYHVPEFGTMKTLPVLHELMDSL